MDRSIPAWAGKPRCAVLGGEQERVYPRVGGETAPWHPCLTFCWGLSPRGRGNQLLDDLIVSFDGSIPAWAGKPWSPFIESHEYRVYPRVGGETSVS